jgi:hypothetical protein
MTSHDVIASPPFLLKGSYMATQADLSPKKADTATTIVYSALVGSAGDGIPAIWRCDDAAAGWSVKPIAVRPTFTILTKWNGPKTARQLKYTFSYPSPITDSTTGTVSFVDKVYAEGLLTLPQGMPVADIGEANAQLFNLLDTASVLAMANSGYAAT